VYLLSTVTTGLSSAIAAADARSAGNAFCRVTMLLLLEDVDRLRRRAELGRLLPLAPAFVPGLAPPADAAETPAAAAEEEPMLCVRDRPKLTSGGEVCCSGQSRPKPCALAPA
jgi:hypothetical protein